MAKNHNNGTDTIEEQDSKQTSSIAEARNLMRSYVEMGFTNASIRQKLLEVLKKKDQDEIKDFYLDLTNYLSLSSGDEKSEYANIKQKDIEEISLLEIQNTILRASVGFENMKKTIKTRIFSEMKWFTQEQEEEIEKNLNDQGQFTLKRLVSSRKDRINFINTYISDTTNILPADIDSIAKDLEIENPTPEQIAIFERWNRSKFHIWEKDISKLLSWLTDAPVSQKRKIIEYFIPTISLTFLIENNIVSIQDAKDLLTESIASLDFDGQKIDDVTMARLKKDLIDQYISGKKEFEIKTSQLTDQNIAYWWKNENIKTVMAWVIAADLIPDDATSQQGLDLTPVDGKLHGSFLEHMDWILRNKVTGISKIDNIYDFIEGSVLKIANKETQQEEYYEVVKTDAENEEGHEWMTLRAIAGNKKIIKGANEAWYNYQDIKSILLGSFKKWYHAEVLTKSSWTKEQANKNIILPIEHRDILTLQTLTMYLDESDAEWKVHGLKEKWVIQYTDPETGEILFATIWKIDPQNAKIAIIDGNQSYQISFDEFLDIFINNKFTRLPQIENVDDFVTFLGMPGLVAKHGLKMPSMWGGHDDHGEGGHGHDDFVDVQAFMTDDGKGHVLIKKSTDDKVIIQEYQWKKTYKDLVDEDPKNKKLVKFAKDEKKHVYTKPFELSYREFAEYIKNKKLVKPLASNPLVDQDNYTTEAPFHEHRSFLKGLLNIWNVWELMKAVEMWFHAFEHTMEKGQKINAAKFMYRFMGKMDNDVWSQVVADYVEAVGETIDKIKKKINWFNNGMKKRAKCLHLIQDKSSKPEEIAAALMVTVEWAWWLYMDEPFVFYSWSWMWFNALVRAAGYSDPAAIKADIADKVKEVNKEHPTEEMYIEQFLKKYGEWDNNPLLMAMGGYPKFRKALIEWRKSEIDKWERDAGELLGIGDRVQLWINKMRTGEFNQVIGIYKSAIGKYAWWPADVLPWMWALSGATDIVHPNVANEFKNFTDGGWHTFHAISFCRNPEKSALYKRVVSKVIHAKLPGVAKEFDAIQAKVAHQFQHHHHRSDKELEEYNKEIMLGLQKIWTKHWKVLHPILQWVDSYILENANDPDFKAYVAWLDETHNYRWSAGNKGYDNDYAWVDGYQQNPSFSYEVEKNSGRTVRTIKRQLDWLTLGSHNGAMAKDQYTHIFKKSIHKFLESIKNIEDPIQKKATMVANYKHILSFLRWHIGTIENPNRYSSVLDQDYMRDLSHLWFDLSYDTVIGSINKWFPEDIKNQRDDHAAENSYGRFDKKISWSTAGEIQDTQARLNQFMLPANDSEFLRTGT
jgi:flavodoxin